jgi:hypothetical protein
VREMLAYDYPVLGAFWTVMWVFLWVMWLVLLFRVITDLFRDHDLSGWSKAAWLVFLILVPFVGVLTYVIVRGRDMGRRERRHSQEQLDAVDAYLRRTLADPDPDPDPDADVGSSTDVDRLAKLAELRRHGDISEAEFATAKEKILH